MGQVSFDVDGYGKIIEQIKKAEEEYHQLFIRLHRDDVKHYLEYDYGSDFQSFLSGLEVQMQRTQGMRDALERYLVLWKENYDSSSQGMEEIAFGDFAGGFFSTITVPDHALDYSDYLSWEYLSHGNNILMEFGDVNSFMKSEAFKKADFWTAASEMSNFGLFVDFFTGQSGNYGNEQLENALSGILNTLPDAGETSDGTYKTVENLTGAGNLKEWVSALKLLVDRHLAIGDSREYFLDSDELADLIEEFDHQWSGDEGALSGILRTLIKTVFSREVWDTLSSGIGQLNRSIQVMDNIQELVARVTNDYTVQISYLNSIQNAFLNNGYTAGPVIQMIDEMKRKYENECVNAISQMKDELSEKVLDETKKIAIKCIPILKDVDFGLSVLSTGANLTHSTLISAEKTLMGLVQYDTALTKSYGSYLGLIEKGIATEDDMEEADRLYMILRETKKKEYQCMMDMTSGSEYQMYKSRLDALNELP